MEDSLTGEGRAAPYTAQNSRNGIVRVEHVVWTKAIPEVAWEIFTDWENWHRISNRYGAIQWTGTPWATGSRIRVEIFRPFKATVDRVITVIEPGQCIAWINHVLGYTMEQWVVFQPVFDGTRIATWLEFTGPGPTIEGRLVHEMIQEYLQEWYEAFRRECDLAAPSI